MNGDFAHFGGENETFDADDVSDVVDLFEVGIAFFAQIVAADVALNTAGVVHDMRKAGLAHDAFGQNSARNFHGFTLELRVVVDYFFAVGVAIVFHDFKRIFACRLKVRQFISSDFEYFVKFRFFLRHVRQNYFLLCHNNLFFSQC